MTKKLITSNCFHCQHWQWGCLKGHKPRRYFRKEVSGIKTYCYRRSCNDFTIKGLFNE